MTPDQVKGIRGELQQGQTHQGSLPQRKPSRPIGKQERLQTLRLLCYGSCAPILLFPGERNLLTHNLQRLIQTLPHTCCAQDWMALNHHAPSILKACNVEAMKG